MRHACLLATILCCGCHGDPPATDPRDRITVAAAAPDALSGTYRDVTFSFTRAAGDDGPVRTARFASADGATVASLVAHDGTHAGDFDVAGVKWSGKSALTDGERAQLRAFAASPVGEAVLNVAAYLYWKAPAADQKMNRVSAVQLYLELAEFYDDAAKAALAQPADTLDPACAIPGCALMTDDAVFDCTDENGAHHDAIPLIDGPPDGCAVTDGASRMSQSHEPGSCYGACGGGCSQCKTADVLCPTGSPGAYACYQDALFDHFSALDLAACAKLAAGGGVPDANPMSAGKVRVCTTADCCFKHDECHRHDKGGKKVLCELYGFAACGIGAIGGYPMDTTGRRLFTANPVPAAAWPLPHDKDPPGRGELGTCDGAHTFTAPAPLPHAREQVACPIHGCKHREDTDGCCDGNTCDHDVDCFPDAARCDVNGCCAPCLPGQYLVTDGTSVPSCGQCPPSQTQQAVSVSVPSPYGAILVWAYECVAPSQGGMCDPMKPKCDVCVPHGPVYCDQGTCDLVHKIGSFGQCCICPASCDGKYPCIAPDPPCFNGQGYICPDDSCFHPNCGP